MSNGKEELEEIELPKEESIEEIRHAERISTLVRRGGSIATLVGTPRCSVFRVRGMLQGQ